MATLEVMTAGDGIRWNPDIGYWAEEWDPDGSLHPLYYTSHIGDRWVNVTTLPMLFAAAPLYDLGGYRAALLLPMLGSVMAALAAAGLARRLGGPEALTFCVVGLASPMTIYALDFWEHSVGVALMAWAVVFLVDVLESDARSWRRSAIAGALLGAAATMRSETLVYTALAAVVIGVIMLRRRVPVDRLAIGGVAAAVPFIAVFAANYVLERQILSYGLRAERAAGIAVAAGDAPSDRLAEAGLTLFGLEGNERGIVLGVLFAALVAVAARRFGADRVFASVAVAGAAAIFLLRASAGGLGFVPGLFVAWALAPAGVLALARKQRATTAVVAIAVAALPAVVATQFRGGAAPQWAGRYVLTSGLLLTAAALVIAPRMLVGLAVAVTAFGLAWTSVRTHGVDRAITTINARDEPVVISTIAHLAREGGATYREKRWLTAAGATELQRAMDVVSATGASSFVLVSLESGRLPAVAGYTEGDAEVIELFDDVTLHLTVWSAS